jgi:ribosomal protein S14
MFQVEIYGRVRRAVRVEGRSQRAVAREFGLSRETVRKMMQYAVPPGYQRLQPIKRPKLGPWLGLDRRHSDRRQAEASQAATHGEAYFRPAEGRASVHRWLHHREGLRAVSYAARSGDVRAADACAGRGAGRLRRSRGRDRWR